MQNKTKIAREIWWNKQYFGTVGDKNKIVRDIKFCPPLPAIVEVHQKSTIHTTMVKGIRKVVMTGPRYLKWGKLTCRILKIDKKATLSGQLIGELDRDEVILRLT